MPASLAAAGMLILVASHPDRAAGDDISIRSAVWIGAVQGLCLPFRGFSRSGATISAGLALGVIRRRAEEFSFALAVVLTPAVIAREAWRLYRAHDAVLIASAGGLAGVLGPSVLGMLLSFVAGLVALRWLSRWLEQVAGICSACTACWLHASCSHSAECLSSRLPYPCSGTMAALLREPCHQRRLTSNE